MILSQLIFFREESKKTAYFEEEEIKSILEKGEFGDMNKLDRLFKSFSRRIRKFTPEESKRFEEDVKKRVCFFLFIPLKKFNFQYFSFYV